MGRGRVKERERNAVCVMRETGGCLPGAGRRDSGTTSTREPTYRPPATQRPTIRTLSITKKSPFTEASPRAVRDCTFGSGGGSGVGGSGGDRSRVSSTAQHSTAVQHFAAAAAVVAGQGPRQQLSSAQHSSAHRSGGGGSGGCRGRGGSTAQHMVRHGSAAWYGTAQHGTA